MNERPQLIGGTLHYSQEKDCCDGDTPNEDPQELVVEVHDGGGGAYMVLKTKRWAFDYAKELEEIVKPLQDAIKRFPAKE